MRSERGEEEERVRIKEGMSRVSRLPDEWQAAGGGSLVAQEAETPSVPQVSLPLVSSVTQSLNC